MSPRFFLHKSLWLFFLSLLLFLVSCVPVISTPEEGNSSSIVPTAVATGETQNLYLPLFQNKEGPFPMPEEIPLTEWRASTAWIPIMPGAQVGQEMDDKYVFTTFARIPNVENYYLEELEIRGWEALSIAESPNKTVLLFQQGEARVTITMDFLVDQELCYVVIEG